MVTVESPAVRGLSAADFFACAMKEVDDRRMPEPVGIMTDFFALSTTDDIDNILIDIDNIVCFNAEHRGGDAPPVSRTPIPIRELTT
jgi:hypothetical protein